MGLFGTSRVTGQAGARLEAMVAADGAERYYDIAESVANKLRDEGLPLSRPHFADKLQVWTTSDGNKQSGFEMWITLPLEEDPKRVYLYVDWDDKVIDKVGALGSLLAGGGPTLRALGKLAKASRNGIPGYEAYSAYLKAMAAAITIEEPSAVIDLRLPSS